MKFYQAKGQSIRINSIHQIEKILDDKFYRSKMVEKAKSRHENDVKTQQYFFTNLETDKERWDFIENYFVGMNEAEAQDKE